MRVRNSPLRPLRRDFPTLLFKRSLIDGDTTDGIFNSDIDHSMYVLNVDLWNEDGTRELNLVRASTGSPCVSTIGAYAYMSSNNGDAGFNSYAQQYAPGYRDASLGPSQAYVQDYQMQSGYNQSTPQLHSFLPRLVLSGEKKTCEGEGDTKLLTADPYRFCLSFK